MLDVQDDAQNKINKRRIQQPQEASSFQNIQCQTSPMKTVIDASCEEISNQVTQEQTSTLFQFSQYLSTHYTLRQKVYPCKRLPSFTQFNTFHDLPQDDDHVRHETFQKKLPNMLTSQKIVKAKKAKVEQNFSIILKNKDQSDTLDLDKSAIMNCCGIPFQPLRITKKGQRSVTQRSKKSQKITIEEERNFLNVIPLVIDQCPIISKEVQRDYGKKLISEKLKFHTDIKPKFKQPDLLTIEKKNSFMSSTLRHQYIQLEKVLAKQHKNNRYISQALGEKQKRGFLDINKTLDYRHFRNQNSPRLYSQIRTSFEQPSSTISHYNTKAKENQELIQSRIEEQLNQKEFITIQKYQRFKKALDKFKEQEDLTNISQQLENRLKIIEINQFKKKSKF